MAYHHRGCKRRTKHTSSMPILEPSLLCIAQNLSVRGDIVHRQAVGAQQDRSHCVSAEELQSTLDACYGDFLIRGCGEPYKRVKNIVLVTAG